MKRSLNESVIVVYLFVCLFQQKKDTFKWIFHVTGWIFIKNSLSSLFPRQKISFRTSNEHLLTESKNIIGL